jgi:hypothetical protein
MIETGRSWSTARPSARDAEGGTGAVGADVMVPPYPAADTVVT